MTKVGVEIVRNNGQRHQIQELSLRLSRECAQTVPEYAFALTTPSDSSNAVKGVVRLFI
jgi:hypothetical protein